MPNVLDPKPPVLIVNRLALAVMMPDGGEIRFRALKGPPVVKAYMKDRRIELFAALDAALAQAVGAQSPPDFGMWMMSMVRQMTGVAPAPYDSPLAPVFFKGMTFVLVEFDLLVSEIQIAGGHNAQLVAHWFEATVTDGPEPAAQPPEAGSSLVAP